MVGKVLGIFIWYDWCRPGEGKLTPAQRLGIVKSLVRMEDIV